MALSHKSLALLAGIGLLAGAVGCDIQVKDGKTSFELNTPQATQQWDRQYPLAPGGQIEVANLNGPIEVSQGPAGTVEIQAVITAKSMSEDQANDILLKGKITEDISPDRVKVETVIPRGVRGSYEVRYRVRAPADAVTTLSTTNGSVKAEGLGGSLKASVVNGSLELTDIGGAVDAAAVNGPLSAKLSKVTAAVRLETTNGRLNLQLPGSSKADLSARVVNGGLNISGFAVENPRGTRIRNLDTRLNGGGPKIDLRTTNGRITITGVP